MTITEPQRLALHAAARTALGSEEGDTLMATLPPANTEIATRQDLEHHAAMNRNDLERVETSLRTDLERVETSLRHDLERVETSLRHDVQRVEGLLGPLETSLRTDIERVETSLRHDVQRVEGLLGPLEGRMGARIAESCGQVKDELTRRIHASELRTMGFIVVAFVADRLIG